MLVSQPLLLVHSSMSEQQSPDPPLWSTRVRNAQTPAPMHVHKPTWHTHAQELVVRRRLASIEASGAASEPTLPGVCGWMGGCECVWLACVCCIRLCVFACMCVCERPDPPRAERTAQQLQKSTAEEGSCAMNHQSIYDTSHAVLIASVWAQPQP